MQRTPFLLLIIYILFSSELICQNLNLKVTGKTDFETKIIDSLNYSKYHKDYNSLEFEIDSIQRVLFKHGFIENKLEPLKKINDSTFRAKIHLKSKYHTIYIHYKKAS